MTQAVETEVQSEEVEIASPVKPARKTARKTTAKKAVVDDAADVLIPETIDSIDKKDTKKSKKVTKDTKDHQVEIISESNVNEISSSPVRKSVRSKASSKTFSPTFSKSHQDIVLTKEEMVKSEQPILDSTETDKNVDKELKSKSKKRPIASMKEGSIEPEDEISEKAPRENLPELPKTDIVKGAIGKRKNASNDSTKLPAKKNKKCEEKIEEFEEALVLICDG
jgi:hypothetical protein